MRAFSSNHRSFDLRVVAAAETLDIRGGNAVFPGPAPKDSRIEFIFVFVSFTRPSRLCRPRVQSAC